jgi:Co/Zn/Cd efflux system component
MPEIRIWGKLNMLKSEYHIAKMDCPSEENMIRLKLEGVIEIQKLEFDLESRKLSVYHSKNNPEITDLLEELNLGSKRLQTSEYQGRVEKEANEAQSKLLWTVLAINLSFFVVEIVFGLVSGSMGLIADSLDMFADASVYGLSLWAIGSTIKRKKYVAKFSGFLQFLLASLGVFEVIRRFISVENVPDYKTMIIVSFLALIANSICLYLLQRSKSEEAHMKASMIFTSNDVIINSGVILAGILVLITRTNYPDLIIGGIVFIIVVRGALRMLKLGK